MEESCLAPFVASSSSFSHLISYNTHSPSALPHLEYTIVFSPLTHSSLIQLIHLILYTLTQTPPQISQTNKVNKHNGPSPFFAVISGVGSGTGAALARRFAKSYAVVLLSRKPSSYESIVADIKASGGTAIGITADATDPAATDAAFAQIAKELPGSKLAAAVYNGGSGMARKPFLELTLENLDVSLQGAA